MFLLVIKAASFHLRIKFNLIGIQEAAFFCDPQTIISGKFNKTQFDQFVLS